MKKGMAMRTLGFQDDYTVVDMQTGETENFPKSLSPEDAGKEAAARGPSP